MQDKIRYHKYWLFSIAILILQLIGYTPITLGILAIAILPIASINEFIDKIKLVPLFIIFLLLSIVIGIYFSLINGLKIWNIMYWGQFYFLAFILLSIKNKHNAIQALKVCTYIIFFLDIMTNLLLWYGINVPWAEVTAIRPGESIPRLGGFKNSALYSGSITFITFCFIIQERIKHPISKIVIILFVILNTLLSGSYRYFIIVAIVSSVYLLKLYKHKVLLFTEYISSIIIVYFATQFTMFISKSNFYRFMIWNYFVNEIYKSPIFGHGFFNMHLTVDDYSSYLTLIDSGVTESCILLLGYCFGIPLLILFLLSIFSTLKKTSYYEHYSPEIGLFIGLSLDLFWGGSFDNLLSFSLLLISMYQISNHFIDSKETFSKS